MQLGKIVAAVESQAASDTSSARRDKANNVRAHPRWSLILSLALLLGLVAPGSHARTYLGSGGTKCADYLGIKDALPDVGKGIDLWVLGYLSGLNMALYSTKQVDLLADASAADIIGFMQGYCSNNERATLNNAANEYWVRRAGRHAR